VLDTNVLMHDPTSLFRFEEHDIYLPMITLEELDNHKKGMSEVARNARQISRSLDALVSDIAEDAIDLGIPLSKLGNKDAKGIVLLKPYTEYYKEYEKRVGELVAKFPLGKAIVGEAAQKAFINLFGTILRLKNILTAFDDFAGHEISLSANFRITRACT